MAMGGLEEEGRVPSTQSEGPGSVVTALVIMQPFPLLEPLWLETIPKISHWKLKSDWLV